MAEPGNAINFKGGDGRIVNNIVYFARVLRKAGLKVGPAAVRDAVEAVQIAGIGSREEFYWVLHSVFVKRREDHEVFDQAFRLFWRTRDLVEKMIAMFSPEGNGEQAAGEAEAPARHGSARHCSRGMRSSARPKTSR
jgi:uncharacterized protein with von Willebrand factor type A (vWA) domain